MTDNNNTVAIEWIDGKQTLYDSNTLRHLRKGVGGFGMSYYNPNSGRYEQPRTVQVIQGSIRERIQTRSASIATRRSRREQEESSNKLPAHLRNHLIYGV